MTKEQFEREKSYRASLAIAKTMLSKGIITMHEYNRINKALIMKYKPVTGSL